MSNKFSEKELVAEEWLKKASDDKLHIKSLLRHRDAPANSVCFVSHQMAEKYFKAFLVFKKKWYPRIHPTDALWKNCYKLDRSFSAIKEDAIFLTDFYVTTRYPGDYPEFSWEDAEEAFEAATKIKDFVLEKIKK